MRDLAQINLFMRDAKEDRVRDKIADSELLPHREVVLVSDLDSTGEKISLDQAMRTSEEAEGKMVRIFKLSLISTLTHTSYYTVKETE